MQLKTFADDYQVCADLGWDFDSGLHDEMVAANVKRLEELEKEHEKTITDEEDQSQLSGVWQSKLDYLSSIGDIENATVSLYRSISIVAVEVY